MSVENATYISELDPVQPPGLDPVGQGDDHLRLIKNVLQNSFTEVDSAVNTNPTELNALDISSQAVSAGDVLTWDGNNLTWQPGGGAGDHSLLTNLDADDHLQYLNNTRGDARYVPQLGGTFTGLVNMNAGMTSGGNLTFTAGLVSGAEQYRMPNNGYLGQSGISPILVAPAGGSIGLWADTGAQKITMQSSGQLRLAQQTPVDPNDAASKAYVDAQAGGAGGITFIDTSDTNYTPTSTVECALIRMSSTSPMNLNITTEAIGGWTQGRSFMVTQRNTGQVTVVPQGVTINKPDTFATRKQHSTFTLIYEGSDVWLLVGDMETA